MVSLNLFPTPAQHDTVAQDERNIDTTNVFEHAYRHLASYRNLCQVYHVRAYEKQNPEIDAWANDLLKTLWTATTTRDPGWSTSRLNQSGLTNQRFRPVSKDRVRYRYRHILPPGSPSQAGIRQDPHYDHPHPHFRSEGLFRPYARLPSTHRDRRRERDRSYTEEPQGCTRKGTERSGCRKRATSQGRSCLEEGRNRGWCGCGWRAYWCHRRFGYGVSLALSLSRCLTGFYSAAPLVGAGISTILGAIGLGGSVVGVLATALASISEILHLG